MGIIAAALALLVRPLFSPVWGSGLLILCFFGEFWLVPFGLTSAAYALAVGFPRLARSGGYENAVAFIAGSLSLFAVSHAIMSWGNPSRIYAFVIPVMMLASAIAFPVLLEEAVKDGWPYAMKHIVIIFLGFIFASIAASLFFMRLEWLGIVMTVFYTAACVVLGIRRLLRKDKWDQRGSNPPPTA